VLSKEKTATGEKFGDEQLSVPRRAEAAELPKKAYRRFLGRESPDIDQVQAILDEVVSGSFRAD
jgi:hypothetical protein